MFAIFPGQGSQKMGMGADWVDLKIVSEIIKNASETINLDIKNLLLEATQEELNKTENAQISIFVLSYAITKFFISQGLEIKLLAGHSLGEYTALAIAEVLSFEDMCKFILQRGKIMHEAAKKNKGGMCALLGANLDEAAMICSLSSTPSSYCFIANDNASKQVVLSGHEKSIERAKKNASEYGFKAIILNTAGPFHSPFMHEAQIQLEEEISKYEFKTPKIPIMSNFYAKITENWKEIIAKHVVAPVRWREILLNSQATGLKMVEIAPSSLLSNMAHRDGYDCTYLKKEFMK